MTQPKKPDLTPLDRSDEELDRLSEITMDDIEAAQVFWKKHAPAAFKNLLDAKEEDGEPDPAV